MISNDLSKSFMFVCLSYIYTIERHSYLLYKNSRNNFVEIFRNVEKYVEDFVDVEGRGGGSKREGKRWGPGKSRAFPRKGRGRGARGERGSPIFTISFFIVTLAS